MNKIIYFATTNKDKVKSYSRRLEDIGWKLKHINLDIPETRDWECREVALKKLEYALKIMAERPVFVEDRGLELAAMNGFPKSHIKDLTQLIKLETIFPLIKDKPEARFTYAVAMANKGQTEVFVGEEKGFIRPTNKANPGLKDVFCYYKYPKTPLSQLSDKQKEDYEKSWTKDDAFAGLVNYLETNNNYV